VALAAMDTVAPCGEEAPPAGAVIPTMGGTPKGLMRVNNALMVGWAGVKLVTETREGWPLYSALLGVPAGVKARPET